MIEMIERVARALFETSPLNKGAGPYEAQSVAYRTMAEILARAAIEAIGTPTDKMITAAYTSLDRMNHDSPSSCTVRVTYAAMIDAALKE